ncbi:hypothetical protein ACH4RA_17825 [Streptomyces smyrnaeus]|uniref:hypothetical protein n=1 Tax=Streptomyces TaxID=1883 RepID=UPI000C18B917|nr:hypothetical protein [Streptomyces sp. RK75]MBQ0866889.1 hypothetical protein [Streptomyces sp. RK75]
MCFQADDFDAVYARMKEAGHDFPGDGYAFRAGGGHPEEALGTEVMCFDDPGGAVLKLIRSRSGFVR